MIAARQIFLGRGGAKLPYDAEVEYLESQPTGGQYIDTDYLFKSDNVEVTASLYSTQSSIQVLFGSEQTISSRRTLTPLVYTDIGNMFSLFYAQNARVIKVNSLSAGNYDLTIKASNRTVQFSVNGTTTSASYSGECLKTLPIYLFAEGFTYKVDYYSKSMRLYGFTIKDNGVLVRDFIPVRFTNELGVSEGAMYDRVSGKLFRNQGTGAFQYGADVVEVEYIESTGIQYISLTKAVDGFDGMLLPEDNNNYGAVGLWNGGSRADTIKYTTVQNRGWCVNNGSNSSGVVTNDLRRDMLRVVVNGTSVSVGGTDYTMGAAWHAYFGNTNFALFGVYKSNDSTVATQSCKIGACKLYYQGTLLFDFVPVRVGMEGAMMDHLTRRIYRNQGTGAFLFGADKKYTPLMCNSYVRDGLVAMWDGVENAGRGLHDPNATVWKDLTGNGYDLNCYSSYEWLADAVKLVGGYRPIYKSNTTIGTVGADTHVSIVAEAESSSGVILGLGQGASTSSIAFTKTAKGVFAQIVNSSGDGKKNKVDFDDSKFSISVNYASGDIAYSSVNGVEKLPYYGFGGTYCTSLCVGDRPNDSSTPFTGKVFTIRLYNRVLTAEEIAQNYAVDVARFNLQTT